MIYYVCNIIELIKLYIVESNFCIKINITFSIEISIIIIMSSSSILCRDLLKI